MPSASRSIAVLVLLAFVASHGSDPVLGASFTVNGATDSVDANRGDGICADANGVCTLRAAVEETNALPGPDAITVPAGVYVFTRLAEPDRGGGLTVSDSLTVTGAGARDTIIDTGRAQSDYAQARVFTIVCAPQVFIVEISGVTIQKGLAEGGGGIDNCGHQLTLRGVTLTRNSGAGSNGGGLRNRWGGGPSWPTVTIDGSSITGNGAQRGGGIEGGAISISNSTISENTGGAVYSVGGVSLTNVDVVGNRPWVDQSTAILGPVTIRNSLLSGNNQTNCSSAITSLGHNISSDSSCNLSGPGDVNGVDPRVGPLADNGGPTLTHALLAGSPAINAGDNNGCPSTDQRGVARPQQGTCDIGAYEYAPPATPAPTPKPAVLTASPTPAPASAPGSPTATAEPSPSPTAKLSPTAKPSASRTPQRSPTPASTPFASGSDDSGGSTALTIGLTLAGLAAASAGGGGAYYVWQRRGTGGPPFRRP